ncbi:uncharacterized protein PgNI_08844 [Pyricularia grisea]|uniref:Uncharacterized protein n=1 Tax=Pyricularia grisea TaxID=148305 RepID=A0A6P8AV42_PYRGI|nr:uncharacterized protein PgNI_08844 [Pyricularia grisea]TLD06091.1 hypothetical protein PgNI_08844 [Pyricularia grisea]
MPSSERRGGGGGGSDGYGYGYVMLWVLRGPFGGLFLCQQRTCCCFLLIQVVKGTKVKVRWSSKEKQNKPDSKMGLPRLDCLP